MENSMGKYSFVDYSNCLVNLASSIMDFSGIETFHPSLSVVDNYLRSGKYNSVALLLYDGMGYDLLCRYLPEDSFLRRHVITVIDSVFPPTTTAATTSVQTGLFPSEHKWLGWNEYFEEIDKTVTIFLNRVKDTDQPAADYHVAHRYNPIRCYPDICPEGVTGVTISPFTDNGVTYPEYDVDAYFSAVRNVLAREGKKAVYAYFSDPDAIGHETGTDSEETKAILRRLNDESEKLCRDIPDDTLVIITADHGHKNTHYVIIERDIPELKELLLRDISIEGRACSFWIKEGCEEKFDSIFREKLGNDFLLLTHEEVMESQIFGPCDNDEYGKYIGDRLAVATSDKCIALRIGTTELVSQHAGTFPEEIKVPVIILD